MDHNLFLLICSKKKYIINSITPLNQIISYMKRKVEETGVEVNGKELVNKANEKSEK